MVDEETKLEKDERFCFKCKQVVDKSDFNAYYEICWDCVNTSTGH